MEQVKQNDRISIGYRREKTGVWNCEFINWTVDSTSELGPDMDILKAKMEKYIEENFPKTEPKQSGALPGLNNTETAKLCPICGIPMKLVPAGISKKGSPYNAFWACPARCGKGF